MKDVPDFSHSYFHDLESMFYVICWLCTLYSGPCSKKRQFSSSIRPYHKTAVAGWNGDASDSKDLMVLYRLKVASVGVNLFESTLDDFDAYFEDIKDCMWRLRDLFFNPTIGRPGERRMLEAKKKDLDNRLEGAFGEEKERIKAEFNLFPIDMRPASVVLDSLLAVVDETILQLPEEQPPSAVEDPSEGAEPPDIRPCQLRNLLNSVSAAAHAD